MMRSCRRWEARITRQLDGELAPREAAELEAHLERCPACRERRVVAVAELTARRRVWHDSIEEPGLGPAAQVAAAAWRRHANQAGRSSHPSPWFRPASWVAAGSLATCVALLFWCLASWRTLRSWSRWPDSSPVYTLCDLAARDGAAGDAEPSIIPSSRPDEAVDAPRRN